MTPRERGYTAVVAGVSSVRLFGLFLLLPVLAVYARDLPGATPTLVGLAIGVYGVTQALLQIPLGILSDRFGRRRIVAAGLIVFALGGVVAALSDTIFGIIAGRALQGAGAISAVLTASLADNTRDTVRTRAVALVGAGIGLGFVFAIVVAPLLAPLIGLSGMFWLTALLAVGALAVAWRWLDDGPPVTLLSDRGQLHRAITRPGLAELNASMFVLHLVLTASFVVLPQVLADDLGLAVPQHALVYVIAMLASLLVAVPMILASDGANPRRELPMIAFGFMAAGQLWLASGVPAVTAAVVALAVLFAGFNYLEARLPAMVSQFAPQDLRGAALGAFATCQFTGVFLGGWLGGWLLGRFDAEAVFTMCAFAAVVGALLCRLARRSESALSHP